MKAIIRKTGEKVDVEKITGTSYYTASDPELQDSELISLSKVYSHYAKLFIKHYKN